MENMIKKTDRATKFTDAVNLLTLFALAISIAVPSLAKAEEPAHHHALSLIGTPKYAAGFKHFDFVNPDAPKGGMVRQADIGAFDSLNPISFKGVAAPALGLIYETLMYSSPDEESTSYGLIAEWASYPDDFSSVTYKLREDARWHDGEPITVDDVIFSLDISKKANPRVGLYYKNIAKAEKTGDRLVTFTFDVKNNRELPLITGQLTIFPKHFWTGKDSNGNVRDLTKTTMEPPLGSGAYKIKDVEPGRSITYERVDDYWGKDLPVNIGQNNFQEIRYDVYRDDSVALEAFKADKVDFRQENNSKLWATAYDFPAMKKGQVKKERIELKRGQPMQGFAFNVRQDKFKDRRVREAIGLAFDFEWSNKNLFYDQYERTTSYFENSELAARGLPKGQELEILNTVKDEVPAEVFTTEFAPSAGGPANMRKNLRKAMKLLNEAGWQVSKEGKPVLRNKKGEAFRLEFLLRTPAFERIILPYIRNLERLGIHGTVRLVDASQYKRRLDNFDFDMIVHSVSQSNSPGNEQRYFWGSKAADEQGSMNVIGIKNKAIDALIDKVIYAKDRAELVAATKALDRVLLWNRYVVLCWFSPYERVAYWDRFARPDPLPSLSVGFPTFWWWDKDAAAKLSAN